MISRLLLAGALAVCLSAPSSGQITLSRATVSSGAVEASGGSYTLRGTIGQPATGVVSGGTFALCQGFWCAAQAAEIQLSLAAILQGAYPTSPVVDGSPDAMRSDLATASFLPEAQPYSATSYDGTPLDYDGMESVAPGFFASNPDYVDWVLVGVRSAAAGPDDARGAFLLHASGEVRNTDGSATLAFDVPPGGFHVVVYHRNHLALMSTLTTFGSGSATVLPLHASANVFGGEASGSLVEVGVVALVGGDGDSDGNVLAGDRQAVWLPAVGQTGYLGADFSLDGDVLADDRQSLWAPNVGRQSAVPGASLRPKGEVDSVER